MMRSFFSSPKAVAPDHAKQRGAADAAQSRSSSRRTVWTPAAAPATSFRRFSRFRFPFVTGRRLDETAPVLNHFRYLAVNLQPGQRVAEGTAVHQRTPRARRESHVDEPALQSEDLPQAFDVAAG